MPTLGERLKAQNEARTRNDAAIAAANTIAEQKKAQEEQRSVGVFFERIKHDIEDRVNSNLPLKNWRLPKGEAFYISWEGSTMNNAVGAIPRGFKYISVARDFFEWCDKNGLAGKFVANHDGIGQESWFEIHVEAK